MPSGLLRVRLTADDRMRSLEQVPDMLRELKLGDVYPDVYQDKNVLMIAGIKNSQQILSALAGIGLIQGEFIAEHFQEAKQETKQGVVEQIKMHSMNLSGLAGIPGHLAMAASGVFLKDWPRVISTPKSLMVPVILSNYGTGKGELKFEGMLTRMREYFEDGGIHIPELDHEEQKTGIVNAANSFLSRYPLQIAFGLGAWGCLDWIRSGWTEVKQSGYKRGHLRMGAGMAGLASDLAVIFLPERKHKPHTPPHTAAVGEGLAQNDNNPQAGTQAQNLSPDHNGNDQTEQPPGFISRNLDYLIGSPLLMKGIFELTNNVMWLGNAFEETKKVKVWNGPDYMAQIDKVQQELNGLQSQAGNVENAKKLINTSERLDRMVRQRQMAMGVGGKLFPYLTFTTGICFLASTALSAISSKNRNTAYLVPEAYEPLYATLARLLLEMPKQDRPETLELMANYLGTEQEIREAGHINVETIKQEIGKRLTVMEKSPWLPHPEQAAEKAHAVGR